MAYIGREKGKRQATKFSVAILYSGAVEDRYIICPCCGGRMSVERFQYDLHKDFRFRGVVQSGSVPKGEKWIGVCDRCKVRAAIISDKDEVPTVERVDMAMEAGFFAPDAVERAFDDLHRRGLIGKREE